MDIKTIEEIKKSMLRLSLSRDDLIEWLLKNTEEDWSCRVYASKYYVMAAIGKYPTLDKSEPV